MCRMFGSGHVLSATGHPGTTTPSAGTRAETAADRHQCARANGYTGGMTVGRNLVLGCARGCCPGAPGPGRRGRRHPGARHGRRLRRGRRRRIGNLLESGRPGDRRPGVGRGRSGQARLEDALLPSNPALRRVVRVFAARRHPRRARHLARGATFYRLAVLVCAGADGWPGAPRRRVPAPRCSASPPPMSASTCCGASCPVCMWVRP